MNYLMKYTAMPVKKELDLSPGLLSWWKKNGITCYIVSKCYVIHDDKKFEVVYPYQFKDFDTYEKVYPEFDFKSHKCINSSEVDCIFDSYDEACEYVNKLNKDIYKKITSMFDATFSDSKILKKMFQYFKMEFYEQLIHFKLIENELLENTKNLENEKIKNIKVIIK